MPSVVEDKLLTRYLLGTLTQTEQEQVEEHLFADADCYDRLCALKEELTDQCVLGDLPPGEKQVFARRFLTGREGRADVLFARALDVTLRAEKEEGQTVRPPTATTLSWREKLAAYFQFPAWQMAMTAAALLLAVGLVWLLMETQRLRQQLAEAQTEIQQVARNGSELEEQLRRARARNEELDQLSRTAQQERDQARQALERNQARQELERNQARSSSGSGVGTMLSLLLVPLAGRGGAQVEELSLTPQTQNVRLSLLLNPGEDHPIYRAEVRTKQGELIQTRNRLPVRRTKDGKAVQITVPARRLQEGSYVASLYGGQTRQTTTLINHYDFKITRGQ